MNVSKTWGFGLLDLLTELQKIYQKVGKGASDPLEDLYSSLSLILPDFPSPPKGAETPEKGAFPSPYPISISVLPPKTAAENPEGQTSENPPENELSPLPESYFEREKITTWENQEVLRWLKMRHLERFSVLFNLNGIDGKMLVEMYRFQRISRNLMEKKGKEVSENKEVGNLGNLPPNLMEILQQWHLFEAELADLFNQEKHVIKWHTDEVVEWLSEDFDCILTDIATSHSWTGTTLKDLFLTSSNLVEYGALCEKYGVLGTLPKVKLLGKLHLLFYY